MVLLHPPCICACNSPTRLLYCIPLTFLFLFLALFWVSVRVSRLNCTLYLGQYEHSFRESRCNETRRSSMLLTHQPSRVHPAASDVKHTVIANKDNV